VTPGSKVIVQPPAAARASGRPVEGKTFAVGKRVGKRAERVQWIMGPKQGRMDHDTGARLAPFRAPDSAWAGADPVRDVIDRQVAAQARGAQVPAQARNRSFHLAWRSVGWSCRP